MKILWHDAAVFELEEAALYYGGIDNELGRRFTAATEIAIAEIKVRPEIKRRFDGEARKARLKRFPYAVVYCLESDTLSIIAVMHLHREPGYWHGRVK